MNQIRSREELRSRILFLETRNREEAQYVRDRVREVVEKWQPANIIRNVGEKIILPGIRINLAGLLLGTGAGMLVNKLAPRFAGKKIRNALAWILGTGVSQLLRRAGQHIPSSNGREH